jgi:hypothetical protein
MVIPRGIYQWKLKRTYAMILRAFNDGSILAMYFGEKNKGGDMKFLILFSMMFMLGTVSGQAATIILKDGRTLTGDIISQDKTKVVVKSEGISLTYYKDEIVSIKDEPLVEKQDEPLVEKDNNKGSDADKEKLAMQYLDLSKPTTELVDDWVKNHVAAEQQEVVLSYLNDDQRISALTRFRSQNVMKYLSSEDLKAAINFFSTPGGSQFLKDLRQFANNGQVQINSILEREKNEAISKSQ